MPTWQNLFSPFAQMNPILLSFGMIALKTFVHENGDHIFGILLQSQDFGPEVSRNLSSYKILVNFPYFTPSTPTSSGMDTK